jgi:hypothetical protein
MKKQNNKGSLTVESVFILIYIIGIVFLLVHISSNIYQKVYMQAIADEAVEMVQRNWGNTARDFETGSIELSESILTTPLYFILDGAARELVESQVEDYINNILKSNSYSVFSNDKHSLEVECDITKFLIRKKIKITITDSNKSAFGVYRKIFGLPEESVQKVEAEGVLLNPTEYIRNLDLAADLLLTTKYGGITAEHATEWRDKLLDCVGEFFND